MQTLQIYLTFCIFLGCTSFLISKYNLLSKDINSAKLNIYRKLGGNFSCSKNGN